jgi:hypothetical protein
MVFKKEQLNVLLEPNLKRELERLYRESECQSFSIFISLVLNLGIEEVRR